MKTPLISAAAKLRCAAFLSATACMGLVLAVGAISCRKEAATKPADVDYYTCSMHPSVRKQNPTDKCPICGMDLEPVKKKGSQLSSPSSAAGSAEGTVYTCPMHPSVKSKNPKDKCPICGMKLEPVKSRATGAAETNSPDGHALNHLAAGETNALAASTDAPGEFTVPVGRQQQIGVTYAKVEKRPLQQSIRTVGVVAYNKQRHWDYVSRIDGYVQKLFVFSRGELVEKDQPLLTIYSPDLLSTQTEFVDLVKTRETAREKGNPIMLDTTERLLASARQRLRLWNINDAQIAELEKTRQPLDSLVLYSPFRGVIQDLAVDQGRKVMNGEHLVDIADLSVMWVWAQFYQDELPLLQKGQAVTVTTTSSTNGQFTGKIALIDPFLDANMRTGRVRIDLENPDLTLRPEMYVNVETTVGSGEGLAVPVAAVIPTGSRNIVFVDKGQGKLEPRYIELGRKYGDFFQVKSGLAESERVVSSANFLIDAEAKLQGALKSW